MVRAQQELDEYLYRDTGCCLHACPSLQCPEPICFLDFPGYKKSFDHFKKLQLCLEAGMDIDQAADAIGLSKSQAQFFYNRIKHLLHMRPVVPV